MGRVSPGKPCFSGANGRYTVLFAPIFRSMGEKCALAEKICASVVDSLDWSSVYSANDGGAAATSVGCGAGSVVFRDLGRLDRPALCGVGVSGHFGLLVCRWDRVSAWFVLFDI